MKKKGLTVALLLSCATAAAAPALPSTNSDLRALEQNKAQTPQQAELTNTQTDSEKLVGGQSFAVNAINFTSPDSIDAAAFAPLVADYVGQELTLSQLQQAADNVTAYLRSQGYTVATAFIPPQQIKDGVVEIRILLGNLGQVTVNNKSGLADTVISSFISRLHSGTTIKTNELETVLNNLNDLPGVSAAGLLKAGQTVGSSDLEIIVANKKAVETILYTDNHGGKYSGRYRYGLQTTINDPGRIGDKFTVGGTLSNEDMRNYNIGYELPVSGNGSRLGIAYSQMDYTLGDYFSLLDAVGKAKTFSIYGSTPLTNTSSSKLDLVYGYDNRQLQDEMRLFGYNAKKSSNALHTGISGSSRGQGSYTGYSALYYWGQLTNEDFDSVTEGSFQKLTGDVNHSRRLGNTVDLLLNFHSQLANKQLDGSEQFSLGGANGVRAYPQGEASGDSGYQATAELRYNTPLPHLSLATFVDFGEVLQRGYDDRHRNLAGWGVGVQYAKAGDYYLRLDYARKLNGEEFQSEDKDKNGRLWFQAYKLF
ncbi:MAG: ShlB/FhaC/HecB family hemolysin secretion/activation protein [Acidaminococcaceae bacterium]|nr:ShlB/FhaC/HecB family hemolysin secretion/activation protein [Acidaminococcaceae bacterium]